MAERDPVFRFPHPAELFKDEPSPVQPPESVGSTQRAATLGALYPRLTMAEALAAVAYRPLDRWPANNPDEWQLARDAFNWAVAVAEIWGCDSDTFIGRAISDSAMRGAQLEMAGWRNIAIAFQMFFQTPDDGETIH